MHLMFARVWSPYSSSCAPRPSVRPSTAPVSAQNRNSLEGKREEGWEREKERESGVEKWGGDIERGDRQTGRERQGERKVGEEGERGLREGGEGGEGERE